MKRILLFAIATSLSFSLFAQKQVSRDANGQKILVGFLAKEDLSKDTAFQWFAANQKGFTPDANAVEAFKAKKDSIHILAFGGTWCDDTRNLLPKFYAMTDAAGFPANRVTLLGVDRGKKTVEHLEQAFGVTNVPTFIVLKNGKEIGRVVEYGKYGAPDKELGEIVSKGKL